MKINPVGQSDSISKVMNVNSNSFSGKNISIDISDTVELSDGAKKYAELVKSARKAMETSDAEEAERAADITSRIGSNSYQVADEDVVKDILGGIPSHI